MSSIGKCHSRSSLVFCRNLLPDYFQTSCFKPIKVLNFRDQPIRTLTAFYCSKPIKGRLLRRVEGGLRPISN